MSVLPSSIPSASLDSPEAQVDSLAKLQSEESSYRSICHDALTSIEEALKREDLDPKVRDELTPLLSSIKEQKENLISIITDAQKVEESLTTEQEKTSSTDRQREIQSLLDQFTKTTGDLGHQLSTVGKLFAENGISA
ncbi:hypothetical protein AAF712_002670 [Marasmius tenuissimus]|uniref:Uncharacterized protein n=1 Tax=Marasmius tenuissimus TaxID=585030 RepID=A0ABR3A9I0_9AGAR|nr:hypothetical protein PM082_005942 [Marasmius tenuissimus]